MSPPVAAPVRTAPLSIGPLLAASVAVGMVGGAGAWVFRIMIAVVHNALLLGRFDLNYDANAHTSPSPWGAGVIAVPAVGALFVVFLVRNFAPEAKGHGVPEVMEALYYKDGRIRPVVAGVKAVASSISIGSGGSVGREGPIVQIGSAFGSLFAGRLRLVPADTSLLVACGAASGIAATFNAPLGGVLFAAELLLLEITARTILAAVTAVAAGTVVGTGLIGSLAAFPVPSTGPTLTWERLLGDSLAMIVVGVVVGAVGASMVGGLYRFEDWFDTRFTNPYLAHVLGMTVVGAGMYLFFVWRGDYSIDGVGYATIADALNGSITGTGVLLALAAGKWLATSLTLGSGASGGVFSPALFLGATIGGALGHVATSLGAPVDPTVFVISGMAAGVGGITGAVFTAAVMVAELTGDFQLIVPVLAASALADATRSWLHPPTVYSQKLLRRNLWVPSGLAPRGLGGVRARDLVTRGQSGSEPDTVVGAPVPRVAADSGLVELIRSFGPSDRVEVYDGDTEIGVVRRSDVNRLLR